MKTIQAVARYFPESCGGIHIHLSEILPVLQTLGVESKVVASQDKPTEALYEYRGVEVFRYPVSPEPRMEPNHGAVPHGGFDRFATWLKAQQAEVYHQHQWTPKCGLPHLKLAKQLGMATVVSVRLPQPICQRQTLMYNGTTACDGRIDPVRCGYCCGVSRQIPAPVVDALGHLPIPAAVAMGGVRRRLGNLPAPLRAIADGVLAPASIPAYVAARKEGLMEMARYADRIVVMSQWVYDALTINGIPPEKLFLLRHGIADTFVNGAAHARTLHTQTKRDRLRIGFLGRWDRNKGIHVLVEAVKRLPLDIPLELVIHGVAQDDGYRDQLIERIGTDPRIQVAKQLKRNELTEALLGFDVLAVPSQWLETGPVVVLEAHACGVPVVGADLGGVAEKVTHGVDGLLVPAGDPQAWAQAFARLATDRRLLSHLREGIQPVRTLRMEAEESKALYQSILTNQPVETFLYRLKELEFQVR